MTHTAAEHFEYDYPATTTEPRTGDSKQELLFPLDGHEIKASADVENYLNKNNDLSGLLSSLTQRISRTEGVNSVELALYHDIEEHWDKLFVIVNTGIDNPDKLDTLEDHLYSSLFEPEAELLSGRVVLYAE